MWQVTAHYVAMTPNGRVFDSSLDRGFPYDIRVGSGQVSSTLQKHASPFYVYIDSVACLSLHARRALRRTCPL